MERSWFLGGALVLAGCFEDAAGPTRFLGEGGSPTTCDTDNLLDAECDETPPCCVKGPTPPLQGPSWVQIVDSGAPGTCPEPAIEGFKAYADMKPLEPHTCGACSCSPGTCTLPQGVHTNAAPCADADGSIAVPLGPDPAAGWEGVCSEDGALPADLQCTGEPCAQSVFVPTMPVSPCKAESGPGESFPDPVWGRTALECKIEPLSGESCAIGDVCAPKPPEGFALCLYAKGEQPTCPAEYPARMVFYQGVQDERGCEACQCSPPAGADCMAIFQVFADTACSSLAGAVVVTEQDDSCVDVIPGTALGSFEASMVVDTPGSCLASGGAPFGTVVPAEPLTLCCQGQPEPPG